jgi:hypothetical protein
VGEEPNYTTALSTINHSILSGLENVRYSIGAAWKKKEITFLAVIGKGSNAPYPSIS